MPDWSELTGQSSYAESLEIENERLKKKIKQLNEKLAVYRKELLLSSR